MLMALLSMVNMQVPLLSTIQQQQQQDLAPMKKESYSKQQNQLIRDFKDTTSGSEKQAIHYLNRTKWNIQDAINSFFDDGASPEKETLKSTSEIEQLFNKLSTPSTATPAVRYMDEEKFSQFNKQYLKFDEENVVLGYILINIMGVETSGYIELKHFLQLFQHLGVTDIKLIGKEAQRLEYEIKNDLFAYKQLYTKIYKFYLIGNKDLSLEYSLAQELWRMYLKPVMHLYSDFMAYLHQKANKPARVHRDLWNMVYQFATTVTNISDVNEMDGWPVFLDEFVEYCKEK